MKVEMVMPQMGESIAEGTILKWRKGVGDSVTIDEDILEISTDKVDTEIPSPATGKIAEIIVQEGQTVAIKTLLAIIETEAGAEVAGTASSAQDTKPAKSPPTAPPASGGGTEAAASDAARAAAGDVGGIAPQQTGGIAEQPTGDEPPVADGRPAAQMSSPHDGSAEGGLKVREFRRPGAPPATPVKEGRFEEQKIAKSPSNNVEGMKQAPKGGQQGAQYSSEGGEAGTYQQDEGTIGAEPGAEKAPSRTEKTSNFLSPLVQSIMSAEGISLDEVSRITGTGQGGRVTKQDVLDYIAKGRALPPAPPPPAKVVAKPTPPAPPPTPPASAGGVQQAATTAPSGQVWVGQGDTIVEMDRMRRAIADHMVRSVHTSPHVYSFTEVDMSRIVKHREANKDAFKTKEGVSLTYTSYFIYCVAKALREYSQVNASVDGYNIIMRKQINVGFAVELPTGGLIVPVIKGVDALSLTGVARGLADLADKARANRLDPSDVSGGTFTVTNVGVFGNTTGCPIINQPQAAILGTGAIKKRAVVVETDDGDFIAIKPIMMISLSYDHRIIDGALAGRFMAKVSQLLETFEG